MNFAVSAAITPPAPPPAITRARRRPSQRHRPHEVVGQGEPEQHRFDLGEPPYEELAQPAIARDGVDALARRGPLFVDRLGLHGPHPLAPLRDGLRIAATCLRSMTTMTTAGGRGFGRTRT